MCEYALIYTNDRKSSKCDRKEANVLFNDAHNTFTFDFYGVEHMVKDW